MFSYKKEIDRLSELLDSGLYAYSLWEMRRICEGLIHTSVHPAVFYVLENVLSELAEVREDRPVVSASC
jgi:hypothetical protein